MTDHEYKQNAYYLCYLVRCVLSGKKPSQEKLAKMDMEELLTVAKAHSLAAIAAYALESAGIEDDAFENEKNNAIRKNILLDAKREEILSLLEEQGIWYMPLKGVYMQEYYPAIGMRQMADNDIAFDISRREDVRTIMADLGFELKAAREVVDEYLMPPVYNFEMHGELFMEYQVGGMAGYYKDLTPHLIKDEDRSFGYHFSNEDFYLFMLAHEYKHFRLGGTGLRSLVDTYVFYKKFGSTLERSYLDNELEKLGILEHEQKSRELAMKLFGGKALEKEEKKLLDYYIFSGTYGTRANEMTNRIKKSGGSKLGYVFDRLFLPMPTVRALYPTFYKHKVLLPLLPFYRVIMGVAKNRKKMFAEIKRLIKN